MLQKKNRLSREEFNRFFAVGKRFHSPYFTLVYTPSPTLKASPVVSKKVSPLAVERNKIRRRMYAIVRDYHRESAASGVYIFIMKSPSTSAAFDTLRSEVYKVLRTITK